MPDGSRFCPDCPHPPGCEITCRRARPAPSKDTAGLHAATSAAFTSGPWNVVEYGDGDSLAIHYSDENRICFMATHGGSAREWARIQANARLIAAAPDLYAHLRFAVKLLSALPALSGTAQVEAMRAALAKAEGR